jgi:murein DD-endopeptidase MepM/ murein hydrolase activator NlpD
LLRILLAVVVSFFLWMPSGQAQEIKTADFSHLTFNSLPAYEKAGSITSAVDLAIELGYDPKRDWLPGDRPAEVFVLGDFQSSLNAERLSLDQIAQLSGMNLPNLRIADMPFLQNTTLSDLAEAVPSLKAFTLAEIPALANLIGGDLSQSLEEALSVDSLVGNLKISEYLGDFSVLDIPNLDLTALSSFTNWQAMAIADIPGLADIELGALSEVMSVFSGVTATHDMTYGSKEHRKTPTQFSITGSNQAGFSVQCAQERGCAYVELEGTGKMHGAQWIAGGSAEGQQMVEGGQGLLGVINNGEEPTGRQPFGGAFKVVLTETDEAKGTADFALYFNVCAKGAFFDLGCTPYFLGPIPMPILNSKEKGMVITGLLDDQGGASSGIEAPKAWEDLRPAAPSEVTELISTNTSAGSSFGGGLCGEGPGGIDFAALADAYKTIESNIDGYESVGRFIQGGGSDGWGRGLGRYQYMSYRRDLREMVQKIPGGSEWLARLDGGHQPTAQELDQFFPPEAQDALFMEDQKRIIELAIAEGHTGGRIVEVTGQIHFGGPDPDIRDSNGTDANGKSIKRYGEELWLAYSQIVETQGRSECGQSTGKFINPVPGKPLTSPFGMRTHPVTGIRKFHAGQDIGAEQGTPILASDGGVVVSAQPMGGYGNFIIIEHDGGYRTRYGHLSSYNVKAGQQVNQGDVIGTVGSTGLSTGPHLHFEIQKDGEFVDPYPLVNW